MFFIINRTRRAKSKDDTRTVKPHNEKKWPSVVDLADFVDPGDTLELIEIETKNKSYYGVPYICQQPYTYGMERINSDKTGYVTAKQKAIEWLAEQMKPSGLILPTPRCPTCNVKAEDDSSLQSLADSGKCWSCRTPRRDVIVPRPKKKVP